MSLIYSNETELEILSLKKNNLSLPLLNEILFRCFSNWPIHDSDSSVDHSVSDCIEGDLRGHHETGPR